MNLFMDYDDNDDNSIESLHEEIERLRKERDDARREVIDLWNVFDFCREIRQNAYRLLTSAIQAEARKQTPKQESQ